MTECDPSGECGRVWYDLDTGQDRGALFADLAEAFEPNYLGLISPDGRFVLSRSQDRQVSGIRRQVSGWRADARQTSMQCGHPLFPYWRAPLPAV